ncbi:MAG: hypothetical protein ACEQSR_08630, partial [Candidatus Methylacidiphilales bacterium]
APLGIFIGLWIAFFIAKIDSLRNKIGCEEYEGSIRHIGSGEIDTQRLIMWDGQSMNVAKVVIKAPQIEPYYNTDNTSYNDEYGIGYTRNFDLMFDANFKESMYQYHEKTDNTLLNGFTNQEVTFKVRYCCEVLDLLGIYEGGTKKLYYNIKLPNYNNWSSIGHIINISLNPNDGFIIIKAKLLRK